MSIRITVQLASQLREIAGYKSIDLDVPEQAILVDAFKTLAERVDGDLYARLFDHQGRLQRSLLTFVNGEPVAASEIETYQLNPADEVTLYPPIAGG